MGIEDGGCKNSNKKSSNGKKSRFIFITGGVLSSLGKGLVSASTGCIIKEFGFSVNIKKIDPYLNIDPGTMNPIQHGEVFVMDDGTEADLDLGNYERIAGIRTTYKNTITTTPKIIHIIYIPPTINYTLF